MPASSPARLPTTGRHGIPPLPLLTLLNYFNYMDRQVVYGMGDKISETFHLTKFEFGWLAWVNLMVFAMASAISGPIADRIGPRKVIFAGVALWSLATIGSAMSQSFWMLLVCRAVVGVGEGAYGPSANALLCAAAPPDKRGRALGIYNIGMAFGATSGLVLANALASTIGWRNVFWIAGGPSILLAASAAFVAAPARLDRPTKLPARAYLLAPTYLIALAGGILVDVRRQRTGGLGAGSDRRREASLLLPTCTWQPSGSCPASAASSPVATWVTGSPVAAAPVVMPRRSGCR